jgi:ligand-binding sensor domain-containing protein
VPGAELWYGGVALCGLSHAQLEVSASVDPSVILSTFALAAIYDVAFDAKGNAWVVGSGSDSVLRFPPGALGQSGSAEPDLEIQSAALHHPGSLVFGADGALWVANRGSPSGASDDAAGGSDDASGASDDASDGSSPAHDASPGPDQSHDGSLLRFQIPSGMTGVQTLAPTVRITSTRSGDLYDIGAIALDASQSLWVTSFAGLLRFDNPAAQSGDVALQPAAMIDKTGYPNNIYFYSVAFDAAGSLWAASSDGLHYLTSITEFANPGGLVGRSNPAPAATITGAMDLLPAGGIAFDGAGNLWFETGESICMYSNAGSLNGTVNPDPAVTLQVAGRASPTTNSHLVFFPPPGSAAAQVVDAAAE